MSVHSRIRLAMSRRGLTLEGLEKAMGRSKGYCSRFLADEREPKLDSLREFARALGVTLDWLVNAEGPMDSLDPAHGETYEMLDGWPEAADELLLQPRWKDLRYAVRAAGGRGVLVAPEQITPDFVRDVARFWLDHAPESERATAEQREIDRIRREEDAKRHDKSGPS